MHAIEVDHLTKYYSNARGVIDLSFDGEQGRDHGLSRAQRLGQNHDHAHAHLLLSRPPAARRASAAMIF